MATFHRGKLTLSLFLPFFDFLFSVTELAYNSSSKVRQIFDALVTRLGKFENITGLNESINLPANEFDSENLAEINLLLNCMTGVLRINVVLSNNQPQSFGVNAPIPEDPFEKTLRFLHTFFATNLSDIRRSASKSGKSSTSSPAKVSLKQNDSLTKRFNQYLVSALLCRSSFCQ